MEPKPKKTNLPMSEGELIGRADNFQRMVAEDMSDLAVYGVRQHTLGHLAELKQSLMDLLPDAYLRGRVYGATRTLRKKRKRFEMEIRSLCTLAKLQLEGNYRAGYYDMGRMARFGDNELHSEAKLLLKFSREHVADLQEGGITPAYLDRFETSVQSFGQCVDEKISAVVNRKLTAIKRVGLKKKLYALLSKLSMFGKTQYRATNYVKHKYYVLLKKRKKKKKETVSNPL